MRFCHRILRGDSRRRRGFIATCAVVFYCCRLFPRPRGPCMRTVFAFFGFSSLRLPFFSLFFFLSFFFSSSSSSFFFFARPPNCLGRSHAETLLPHSPRRGKYVKRAARRGEKDTFFFEALRCTRRLRFAR